MYNNHFNILCLFFFSPSNQIFKSILGFTLSWASPFKAEITIDDDNLRGNICGICGNANGDPDDDMVTPTNETVSLSVVTLTVILMMTWLRQRTSR